MKSRFFVFVSKTPSTPIDCVYKKTEDPHCIFGIFKNGGIQKYSFNDGELEIYIRDGTLRQIDEDEVALIL